MSSMAALFSPPTHISSSSSNPKPHFSLRPRRPLVLRSPGASAENGGGLSATAVEEPKAAEPAGANGSLLPGEIEAEEAETLVKFEDPKWVNGTWDLTQFLKDGRTDWDAVIDADYRLYNHKTVPKESGIEFEDGSD